MSKDLRLLEVKKHSWSNCNYCANTHFKSHEDFTRHLKEKHCTVEGGSFVCRYGYNGVCSSLPVEGVCDEDYEDHVQKHHVFSTGARQRKSNSLHHVVDHPNVVPGGQQWTVYSASQNLPAVLNDPSRGMQRDFFTKVWGISFVEKSDFSLPSHLPDITLEHFEPYLKRVGRKLRKHARLNKTSREEAPNQLLQHFPNLRTSKSLDKIQIDISEIPKIFLHPNLNLASEEIFNEVFPYTKDLFSKDKSSSDGKTASQSEKLLQEKLSHYLDLVEVQIAQQVAEKSDAFFHAMTSYDALSVKLKNTIGIVRALREKLQKIDNSMVKDALNILRLERSRANHMLVSYKLKLMATVHQTQPTIQLLLSTADYVAALELISTTQDILIQELAGVHSFRHLESQLMEMERLIDKMLSTEFERYATADLNRPLGENQDVLEGDKLISIIFGMLRQKHFHFIDIYKEEAFTAIKAVVKQMVIEVVAASDSGDSELALTGLCDQLQGLSLPDWLNLLEGTTSSLLQLIYRVKAVHDVMQDAVNVSAGKSLTDHGSAGSSREYEPASGFHIAVSTDPSENLLSVEEHGRVTAKLRDMLTSVCDYAHERVSQLLSMQDINSVNQGKDRQSSTTWLVEKATASEMYQLARMIDTFTEKCESVSGRQSSALRSAFKVQATKFIQKFHQDRKNKLNLILDCERWKQEDVVPTEFQDLVDGILATGKFSSVKREIELDTVVKKPASFLFVGEEKYAVVGTALLLVKLVAEYCECSNDLSPMASQLCRHLAELLQLFNCKCWKLVLGAGALQVAGLKTITSTNLALASRALQLLLWLLPHVKNHFLCLLQKQQSLYRNSGTVNALDSVEKNIVSHVSEIEEKISSIICNLVTAQLQQWDAKPPVPSQAFRSISRHLKKLHEAVATVLPKKQVERIYQTVNKTFKAKLREQLIRMNIVNDWGPQHGHVTSELAFYVETLTSLEVLPPDELSDYFMKDIWESR